MFRAKNTAALNSASFSLCLIEFLTLKIKSLFREESHKPPNPLCNDILTGDSLGSWLADFFSFQCSKSRNTNQALASKLLAGEYSREIIYTNPKIIQQYSFNFMSDIYKASYTAPTFHHGMPLLYTTFAGICHSPMEFEMFNVMGYSPPFSRSGMTSALPPTEVVPTLIMRVT